MTPVRFFGQLTHEQFYMAQNLIRKSPDTLELLEAVLALCGAEHDSAQDEANNVEQLDEPGKARFYICRGRRELARRLQLTLTGLATGEPAVADESASGPGAQSIEDQILTAAGEASSAMTMMSSRKPIGGSPTDRERNS